MAKKATSVSKNFDLNDLNTFLTKEVNKKGDLIDKLDLKIDHYISSGIYILDALLSAKVLGGGIPNNRVIGIGGESGTGKTYLALNFAKQAQRQGYFIIYLDTEGAIDTNLARTFGLDPNKFRLDPLVTVEEFKIYMAKFLRKMEELQAAKVEIPKILIVLDSLGNLASAKEVSDAESGEQKVDMTRAKQLKSIFRIATAKLTGLNIPMIMTNHTYMTQEMYPKEVFSGGTGAIYNASAIIMLSKAKLKDEFLEDDDLGQSGLILTAKTQKNRMAKPKKVKFELSFLHGANPYKGLDAFCTAENFDKVGIAKGKMEVNKETGEETFKAGGNFWYVRHIGKSVPGKFLHTSKVFTPEVLEALDEILHDYFRYKSMEEQEAMFTVFDETEKKLEEGSLDTGGLSLDQIDSSIFNLGE
jgi:RecA/RadA recombinase